MRVVSTAEGKHRLSRQGAGTAEERGAFKLKEDTARAGGEDGQLDSEEGVIMEGRERSGSDLGSSAAMKLEPVVQQAGVAAGGLTSTASVRIGESRGGAEATTAAGFFTTSSAMASAAPLLSKDHSLAMAAGQRLAVAETTSSAGGASVPDTQQQRRRQRKQQQQQQHATVLGAAHGERQGQTQGQLGRGAQRLAEAQARLLSEQLAGVISALWAVAQGGSDLAGVAGGAGSAVVAVRQSGREDGAVSTGGHWAGAEAQQGGGVGGEPPHHRQCLQPQQEGQQLTQQQQQQQPRRTTPNAQQLQHSASPVMLAGELPTGQ